jgi:hypothetical protein
MTVSFFFLKAEFIQVIFTNPGNVLGHGKIVANRIVILQNLAGEVTVRYGTVG